MRWFNGGIAEAIAFSKTKGAVFVVYIEGKDEKSQQITKLIETAEVTSKLDNDNFVAVKIEAGSLPHQQFSEFYNQTPVPSIYFIGKNGSPIKIVVDAVDVDSLSKELNEVLNKAGISPSVSPSQGAASASENFIASEQAPPKPENVVCDNGVCVIKKKPEPEQSTSAPAGDQTLSAEEKMERAKKLLDAKREEKERQEKELEKQKEIERRKMGQEVQKMKQWQEDLELKQLKEDREKEKRQEREARERVLAQIAQDKAERAAKFSPPHYSSPITDSAPGPSTSSKPDSNTARLQFKMPDGSTKTQDFPSSDKLISAVNFVKANLNVSSKFSLSTTFPRKQFTEKDHEQTLSELQLTPNAVILVLPLNHGSVSTNQGAGGMMGFVYSLLTPLFGILNFIKAFLGFGGDSGPSGESQQGYSSEASRRSNSVQSCNQFNFDNQLKTAGSKLVVVDFFATWCGPCKVIAPELERMAKEFPNVVFLKVDVDQNSDLTRQHNVTAMPTFIFFKNRRELTRIQGADSYGIRSTIQRYK